MPRQNRVDPMGEIVAHPSKESTFMGNRGVLHTADGKLGAARWKGPHWICCLLKYKGAKRPLMAPGRYTELFFLDEATALAAGHRPCSLCRHDAYRAFREHVAKGTGETIPNVSALDALLHSKRLSAAGERLLFEADPSRLRDGVFISVAGRPGAWLIVGGQMRLFGFDGYGAAESLPSRAQVITPEPTVAAILAGYTPALHPSAKT